MWKCIGLWLALLLSRHALGFGDQVLLTTQECCDSGVALSRNTSEDCTSYEVTSALKTSDVLLNQECILVLEQCCLEQKKQDCDIGIDLASSLSCDVATGVERKCCKACLKGTSRGKVKGARACSYAEEESAEATFAYQQCCENTVQRQLREDTEINENSNHIRVTRRAKPSNILSMCEEYAPNELCAHHCIPVPGSYKCECNPGYMLMPDGRNCKEVTKNRCKPRNPCQHKCNDNGVDVKCSCRRGYQLMADGKSCEDIDECVAEPAVCLAGTQCYNIQGSYKCIPSQKPSNTEKGQCPSGFARNLANNVCDDINECQLPFPPCPSYVCENTIGGYKCDGVAGDPANLKNQPRPPVDDRCPPGFRNGYNNECEDVDECMLHKDDCNPKSQFCVNTRGSFFCQDKGSKHCLPGFKLNPKTTKCEDINECEDGQDICTPDQVCVNVPGEYDCKLRTEATRLHAVCPEGMRMKPGSSVCEDVDECVEGTHLCDQYQNCLNTNGSYECNCKLGFRLDPTVGACVDINECANEQHNCVQSQRCDNTVGSFLCIRITSCGTGYVLQHSTGECEDIDECEVGTHNCANAGPNYQCVNMPGSFRCVRKRTSTTTTTTAEPEFEYYYSEEYTDENESNSPKSENKTETSSTTTTTVKPQTSTEPPTTSVKPIEISSSPETPTQPKLELEDKENRIEPDKSNESKQPDITYSEPKRPQPERPTYVGPEPLPESPSQKEPQTEPPNPPATPPPTYVDPHSEEPEQYQPKYETRTPIPEQPRYEPEPPRTETEPPQIEPERPRQEPERPRYAPESPESKQRPRYEPEPSRAQHMPSPHVPLQKLPTYEPRPIPTTPHKPPSYERPTTSRPTSTYRAPHEVYVNVGSKTATVDADRTDDGSVLLDTKKVPKNEWTKINVRPTSCQTGFEMDEYGACFDIDECATMRHTCSGLTERCRNTMGGYLCDCAPGFRRDLTTGACDLVTTSSSTTSTTPSPPTIAATPKSYNYWWGYNEYQPPTRPFRPRNLCDVGFHMNPKTGKCEDINECTNGQANCAAVEICVNTEGGYRCECPPNWRLDEIRHRCIMINSKPQFPDGYGNEPQYIPLEEPELIKPTKGKTYVDPDLTSLGDRGSFFKCPWGYRLADDNTCEDIDECANGGACGPVQSCTNLPGGYTCSCPRGQRLIGDHECEDVDECAATGNKPLCSEHADCVNTVGSYQCKCHSGFRTAPANDKVCTDVDECSESRSGTLCQQRCNNVWGGYKCSCHRGYRLNPDNRTCSDVDECAESKSRILCIGRCLNEPGSFRCSCPSGYKLSEDQRSCIDIDECETGEAPCARGGTQGGTSDVCLNVRGGYRCYRITCPPGYQLENKHRCTKIQSYCAPGDWACSHQPSTYSHNYITFVSNLYIPDSKVDLFTMRGPSWPNAKTRFTLRVVKVSAPPTVKEKADMRYFLLIQTGNQGVVSLVKSLEGPQSIEVELTMELYNGDQFGGIAVAKLFIQVSEYEF